MEKACRMAERSRERDRLYSPRKPCIPREEMYRRAVEEEKQQRILDQEKLNAKYDNEIKQELNSPVSSSKCAPFHKSEPSLSNRHIAGTDHHSKFRSRSSSFSEYLSKFGPLFGDESSSGFTPPAKRGRFSKVSSLPRSKSTPRITLPRESIPIRPRSASVTDITSPRAKSAPAVASPRGRKRVVASPPPDPYLPSAPPLSPSPSPTPTDSAPDTSANRMKEFLKDHAKSYKTAEEAAQELRDYETSPRNKLFEYFKRPLPSQVKNSGASSFIKRFKEVNPSVSLPPVPSCEEATQGRDIDPGSSSQTQQDTEITRPHEAENDSTSADNREKWATPGPSPLNKLAFTRYSKGSTFYMPPNVANKEKRECRKRFAGLIASDPAQMLHILKHNEICFKFLHPKHCNRHTIFYAHGVDSQAFCLYCRTPSRHNHTSLDLGIMTRSQRCQSGFHTWEPVEDHQFSLKCTNCTKADPYYTHWGPITDEDLLEALT